MSTEIIVAHPDNIRLLKEQLKDITVDQSSPAAEFTKMYGTPFRFKGMPNIPIFKQKWVRRKERFVTYEECDDDWTQFFGFGHWEDTDERLFYRFKSNQFEVKDMFPYPLEIEKPKPRFRFPMHVLYPRLVNPKYKHQIIHSGLAT